MADEQISATSEVIQPPVIKKTTVFNTTNIKSSPITTILGGIMFLSGLGIIVFIVVVSTIITLKSPSSISPLWGCAIGGFLIAGGSLVALSPDSFIGIITKFGNKKAGEI